MTRNQLHGKKFEDLIKAALFPGAADSARSVTARFDVEAKFDRVLGLPTSIKSGKGKHVSLSDARRFWEVDQDFRMIFGSYSQEPGYKKFAVIHEFLFTPAMLHALRGEIDLDDIAAFHHGLGLTNFPIGRHSDARVWALSEKRRLFARRSSIILNPKIDSKSQRRLQCSVPVSALVALCESAGRHVVHNREIGDLVLPFTLRSSAREFN
jgi:hypothetical protein